MSKESVERMEFIVRFAVWLTGVWSKLSCLGSWVQSLLDASSFYFKKNGIASTFLQVRYSGLKSSLLPFLTGTYRPQWHRHGATSPALILANSLLRPANLRTTRGKERESHC